MAVYRLPAGALDRRTAILIGRRRVPEDVDLDIRELVGQAACDRAGQQYAGHLGICSIRWRDNLGQRTALGDFALIAHCIVPYNIE
jgi:hypothetical protein